MEPKKVIKSIDDKMGFTPEILNMMGEMNPELFELLEGKEGHTDTWETTLSIKK